MHKMDSIRKILEEADGLLTANQIAQRFPGRRGSSPHAVGALLRQMDDVRYINLYAGREMKRYYYLVSNTKIISGESTKWQSLRI